MEGLPKDIVIKLALELSPPDLINFCLVDKKFNICDNKDFWRQKIQIDYPYVFEYYSRQNRPLANPKNTYIRKFTEVFRAIEKSIDIQFPYSGDVEKKEMSVKFHDLYREILEFYLTKGYLKDSLIKKHFPEKNKYNYNEIKHLMRFLLNKDHMYKL